MPSYQNLRYTPPQENPRTGQVGPARSGDRMFILTSSANDPSRPAFDFRDVLGPLASPRSSSGVPAQPEPKQCSLIDIVALRLSGKIKSFDDEEGIKKFCIRRKDDDPGPFLLSPVENTKKKVKDTVTLSATRLVIALAFIGLAFFFVRSLGQRLAGRVSR